MSDTLQNAIRNGHILHAYLLCCEDMAQGAQYAAKLAELLLCEENEPQQRPCGKCHSCMQAAAGTHPDIIRLIHEKDNSVSVDEIRVQINDNVKLRPFDARYKVFIMEDAHLMTVQAQNALLKTIEEPPEYAVMFLLVPDEKLLLETIRSRCAVYRVSAAELQPFDEETFRENVSILLSLRGKDRTVIPAHAALIAGRGSGESRHFLEFARKWYRDVLVFKKTGDRGALTLRAAGESIAYAADRMSAAQIDRALREIDRAESRLISNVNSELTLELALLSM